MSTSRKASNLITTKHYETMAFNLLDLVKDQVMGQLSGQASSFLGESEEGVSKALGGIFPAILGSVAGKATEEGGMSGIMDMIKGADSNAVSNISGLFGDGAGSPEGLMEKGGSMLTGLLGDKMGGLSSVISNFAGIKGDSASSLMSMAAPMLMGLIGKKVKSEGMGMSGIQSMLGDQAGFVKDAMPSGLASMMGGLDMGSIGGMLGGLGDAGKGMLGGAAGIVGGAAAGIGGAAAGLGNAGKSAISGAGDLASNTANAGKKIVGDAGKTVGNAGKKVIGGAGKVAGGAANAGKKVVGNAGKVVGGAAGAVGNAGKNVVGGAGKVAGAAVETGGSIISTILKWAIPILAILIGGYFVKGCMDGKSLTDAASGAMGDTMGAVKGAGDMVGDAASATAGAVGDAANATAGAVGDAVDGTMDAAGNVVNAAGDAANAAGNMASNALGKVNDVAKAAMDKITFTAGSAGSQFKDYIAGGSKGDARFTFNNVNFASGSARMDAASGKEVDNLAAIMKAYPEVKVNIEGYTDNTGNAAGNMALSKARAEAVKARLTVAGVSGDRMSAAGYGDKNPVADNGTKAGQAQNRRIEVTIAK